MKKPLFSEHEKKGLIQIKVSENPRIWMSKARWIYEQNHPDYKYKKGDKVIYLDGNNRNFDPQNLEVVSNAMMLYLIQCGGVVKDHPEETRIHLLQAKLKKLQLDKGEKAGLVKNVKGCRYFTDEYKKNCAAQKRKYRKENPELWREKDRQRRLKMTPEQLEKKKKYGREYYWKKKELLKS